MLERSIDPTSVVTPATNSSVNGENGATASPQTSPQIPSHPATSRLSSLLSPLAYTDGFEQRHIGPDDDDIAKMLHVLGLDSVEALIDATVPQAIRMKTPLKLDAGKAEYELLQELKEIAQDNQVFRSFIGMGYHNCITPPVIQRNVLENPGWYTQYTPYQPEISQGRLEALLNFQTLVTDLTGLEIANASLLDEGTAAAEAMAMSYGLCKTKAKTFWISDACHPQTIALVQTRAEALGIEVIVGNHQTVTFDSNGDQTGNQSVFGVLLQYPATDGAIYDYQEVCDRAHAAGALVTVAADLLSLTLLKPPGEFGADIAIGNTQRFGVPLGYGGPHAAYFATREAFKRQIPGRLVGVSKDNQGQPALRLSLQTREQHIRRDKATSNICTAQVLLAIMASTYAVYHGPEGLRQIAERVHLMTVLLAEGLKRLGYTLTSESFFDTLQVELGAGKAKDIIRRAHSHHINLRQMGDRTIGIALDETVSSDDLIALFQIFAGEQVAHFTPEDLFHALSPASIRLPAPLRRTTPYLAHPVFNRYHSETELLRYLYRLQVKDLSLATAMIPLGSCTMKLNATAEMLPVTWAEFGQIHPFAPLEQTKGYQTLFEQLEQWLAEITGFAGISLQPNAGSQGEYAGLLVIRRYHESRHQGDRTVCLIPTSAHGTNPASAVMAGMTVVPVACDADGNIDLADLQRKAEQHQQNLAALMVTYPSTHGVFEEGIREICAIAHAHGAQVYMDGANMNAQVGICRPADFGADVCHLNLHKTFCIPHGGGGPGMGPIGVAKHLVPFLPDHPIVSIYAGKSTAGKSASEKPASEKPVPIPSNGSDRSSDPDPSDNRIGAISAAPWGSSSILPISWMYIALMGAEGLTKATQVAILNANYIAKRLENHYPVLYKGKNGWVAHECIIDLRQFKKTAEIEVDDIAKRLIDYGFHPPTVSWPVAGTIMVEPTESESKQELDRFCDAMIAIRSEIQAIETGEADRQDNLLKNAPHTALALTTDWTHPYTREQAVYPTQWTREQKFWPAVGRIDQAYGDRNLVCTCPSMDSYE